MDNDACIAVATIRRDSDTIQTGFYPQFPCNRNIKGNQWKITQTRNVCKYLIKRIYVLTYERTLNRNVSFGILKFTFDVGNRKLITFHCWSDEEFHFAYPKKYIYLTNFMSPYHLCKLQFMTNLIHQNLLMYFIITAINDVIILAVLIINILFFSRVSELIG